MSNENKPLTKKQIKLFARLFVGSIAWHYDLDCDELSEKDLEDVMAESQKLGIKILGVHPSFGQTNEILDYVKNRK